MNEGYSRQHPLAQLDTANHFEVVLRGDGLIGIYNEQATQKNLTVDEAVNLAAWILALADPTLEKLKPVLLEVLKPEPSTHKPTMDADTVDIIYRQQSAVNAWNSEHGIGTRVVVTKDDRSELETETTSEAWLMGGHSAVVKVKGISGGYLLSRVRPAK